MGEPLLVVDDNPTNLKLTRVVLTAAGYDVQTATSAEEALAVLGSFRPRLVLVDVQMPGMDGLELTRRLKAHPETATIPVVALTAYAMKGDEQRALEAGCSGYLAKPVDTRTLAELVARFLAPEAAAP